MDQHWRMGEIDKDKNVHFYMMFGLQTWFIVAHELGHALLGHLASGSWIPRESPMLGTTIRQFSPSHQMEFEADSYALNLLLSAPLPSPLDRLPTEAIAEAIDILFSLFIFLEGTGDIVAGRDPWAGVSGTHPPATARAARLRLAHRLSTPSMDGIRDELAKMTLLFGVRWPEIQKSMKRSVGMENRCLL
jgi:hypothetical protein